MDEFVRLSDAMIFDLEDAFARERGVCGRHPRPLGTVKFLLVGRFVNGVRVDFKSPIEMIVKSNNSGYQLFFGQARWADKFARRMMVEGVRYIIRIVSSFYQQIERDDIEWPVTRPVSPYFFDLQPGYSYPFPAESTLGGGLGPTLLRGALLRADGEGIANATLRVRNGSNAYRTDSTGKWVLVFPDTQVSGDVTLSVSLTDPVREIQVENVPVIRGRETGLPLTALEGRVVTRAGAGISGAVIEIGSPPSKSKTRSNGSWFYYFPLNQPAAVVGVTARLPDGRSLTHSEIEVQPRITTPVPVFQFS